MGDVKLGISMDNYSNCNGMTGCCRQPEREMSELWTRRWRRDIQYCLPCPCRRQHRQVQIPDLIGQVRCRTFYSWWSHTSYYLTSGCTRKPPESWRISLEWRKWRRNEEIHTTRRFKRITTDLFIEFNNRRKYHTVDACKRLAAHIHLIYLFNLTIHINQ